MPDIFDLLGRWWKRVFLVVLIAVIAIGAVVFTKPRLYLSTTTSVPATAYGTDKSRIFSDKIEGLYGSLGGNDDLDMIIGTSTLDTVYLAVSDEFNLQDHYKIDGEGNEIRVKSARRLQTNTRVIKSDYGELKVKVWDTDKHLAPQLANAITARLQLIHQNLQAAGNESTLNGLRKGLGKLKLENDSIPATGSDDMIARKKRLQENIIHYEQLISEYQLMVDSKPPVLIVVEKATAASKPDKPKRLQALIATAVLSFVFAIFAALILDRKKTEKV